MKFHATLIAALAGVGTLSTSAITFRDVDHPGALLTAGAGGSLETYMGDFDLTAPGDIEGPFTIGAPYSPSARGTFSEVNGFVPGEMQAISGSVKFWIRDNAIDSSEAYAVDLGSLGQTFATGSNFGSWRFLASGISIDLLMTINSSGHLSYYVTATEGNFILDYAMLQIEAVSLSVPDGGATALLLGFGFLGLAGTRRRFLN